LAMRGAGCGRVPAAKAEAEVSEGTATQQRQTRMPRDKIILECTDCRDRNYFTDKNKRKHPERVEWKKFCPRCNKHSLHKESK